MLANQNSIATKRKAQFIILAAFLLGIVVGASGQYLLLHRSMNKQVGTSVPIIDELNNRLSLTQAQRTEIDKLLAESRRQYQLLDDEVRPQYKAIRLDTRKRIATLLTAEQQTLFEQYTRELDAKREAKEREAREKNLATPTPAK
ncbi:MAG: hypothetical protein JNK38_16880 [Acidobacteria bacterium]|nr:hypothetical protein [Acidobacteriota bacterium]